MGYVLPLPPASEVNIPPAIQVALSDYSLALAQLIHARIKNPNDYAEEEALAKTCLRALWLLIHSSTTGK